MAFEALTVPLRVPQEMTSDLVLAWPTAPGSERPWGFVGSGPASYLGPPQRYVAGLTPVSGRVPFTCFVSVVFSAHAPVGIEFPFILSCYHQTSLSQGFAFETSSGKLFVSEAGFDGTIKSLQASLDTSPGQRHVLCYVHQPYNFAAASAYRALFLNGVLVGSDATVASAWLAQNPLLVTDGGSNSPSTKTYSSGRVESVLMFARAFTTAEVARYSQLLS